MAKRKYPKMTREEHVRRDETHRLALERIAYHEAKAREAGEWVDPPPGPADEATHRLARQRIAYREAREREYEEPGRARRNPGPRLP